jgi:hypothetical protein
MRLKKATGGTSIGPHHWPHDGSVTEVPDELGRELLAIPEGGFERAGEDEEDGKNPEFTEVVEVGYVLAADAPPTPGDGGQVPDRLSDRTAYKVTGEGTETVPPEPAPTGEHPRAEVPGENRAGVKDVDRATDADAGRDGTEGKRDGEPKRRGTARKHAAE